MKKKKGEGGRGVGLTKEREDRFDTSIGVNAQLTVQDAVNRQRSKKGWIGIRL